MIKQGILYYDKICLLGTGPNKMKFMNFLEALVQLSLPNHYLELPISVIDFLAFAYILLELVFPCSERVPLLVTSSK